MHPLKHPYRFFLLDDEFASLEKMSRRRKIYSILLIIGISIVLFIILINKLDYTGYIVISGFIAILIFSYISFYRISREKEIRINDSIHQRIYQTEYNLPDGSKIISFIDVMWPDRVRIVFLPSYGEIITGERRGSQWLFYKPGGDNKSGIRMFKDVNIESRIKKFMEYEKILEAQNNRS